jgi:hypothetical protein
VGHRLSGLATCVLALTAATPALAHRQAGLECIAPPFPPDGTSNVPTNVLIFDFAAPILNPDETPIPTLPAPAPWDFDSRYRVPSAALAPNTEYLMIYQVTGGSAVGSFTTGAGPDTQPPTAPVALGHFQSSDPNAFTFCISDRLELIPIIESTDDQTPPALIRYSVSEAQSDGGLSVLYNDLTPVTFSDGGVALALEMGLQGLPDDYVVQARDLAGNLSAPSTTQAVDVGPTCDFAESTAGRGPPSLVGLWVFGLWLLRPRRRWLDATQDFAGPALRGRL